MERNPFLSPATPSTPTQFVQTYSYRDVIAQYTTKRGGKRVIEKILIANNGITGNPADLDAAHNTIAMHLAQKRTIVVITRTEINGLRTTADVIHLIKEKMCDLAVGGRIA